MTRRIAIVVHSLQMGGAEKVAAELSRELAKTHTVFFVVFDSAPQIYPHGGIFIDLDLPSKRGIIARFVNFLQRAYRLRRVYQEQQVDGVIAIMEHAGFPSILASRLTLSANHCNPEKAFSRIDWWFARWLLPYAKQVVTVSKAGRDMFEHRLGLQNLTCLYNPVDFEHIQQQAAAVPDVTFTDPYLIAVGRLEPEKNFAGLIQVYARTSIRDQFKLVILGEGTLHAELTALIAALNLQDRVLLLGFMLNPYPYIAGAHVLVLNSWHEGFPLVLVEALGLGVPVIATDCDTGPREIISGKNGCLVPVGDEAVLLTALNMVCSDMDFYNGLKQHARSSVQHLSLPRITQQWLTLLSS